MKLRLLQQLVHFKLMIYIIWIKSVILIKFMVEFHRQFDYFIKNVNVGYTRLTYGRKLLFLLMKILALALGIVSFTQRHW